MQITLVIFKAMTQRQFKAWNLAKENTESREYSDIDVSNKVSKSDKSFPIWHLSGFTYITNLEI
jgi:hypothetical protein